MEEIKKEVSLDIIESHIDKFIENHAKKRKSDFRFRRYQREVIIDIVKTFLEGTKKTYVLEAPVGSGKSMIAICSSYVLNQYGKIGYILASDLSLQTQYEEDIKELKIGFNSIRGVDNYLCTENDEKFSLGDCSLREIYGQKRKKLPCYSKCPYLQARERAIESPTSLLNYSYWILQRNYVAKQNPEEPFTKRDFVICDEAHKIVDIIQGSFSPTIDLFTLQQLEKTRKFLEDKHISKVFVPHIDVEYVVNKIFMSEDKEEIFKNICEFETQMLEFREKVEHIKIYISKHFNSKPIPKDWKYGSYLADYVKDTHTKFSDFVSIIKKAGIDSLIKDGTDERKVFKCLDESYLMDKYFHNECEFQTLMSATIGDGTIFASLNSISLDNAKFIRTKSTFDYSKSPIYAFTGKNMSMKDKEKSMPWLIDTIDKIIEQFKGKSGIIHCTSYSLSQEIFRLCDSNTKKRLLCYSSPETKRLMIEEFIKSDDKIICGPSITEGLDLYDDRSRFQIIAKIQFPSLGDKFVAAKLKINPDWYSWKTILHLLQGVGRSVRHDSDYCVTYILDGSFTNAFNRNENMFNREFIDRIHWLQFNVELPQPKG